MLLFVVCCSKLFGFSWSRGGSTLGCDGGPIYNCDGADVRLPRIATGRRGAVDSDRRASHDGGFCLLLAEDMFGRQCLTAIHTCPATNVDKMGAARWLEFLCPTDRRHGVFLHIDRGQAGCRSGCRYTLHDGSAHEAWKLFRGWFRYFGCRSYLGTCCHRGKAW